MKLFKFKYSRTVYGSIALVLGVVFALIPVIPVGYLFLFIGAFLLTHRIPIFRRFKRWLKKRDDKGRLEKIEEKMEAFFGEE